MAGRRRSTTSSACGIYWLAFGAIDLLAGVVAFGLEAHERWRLLWLLLPQRFGYRQMMYYVVIRAITPALRGPQRRLGQAGAERAGDACSASLRERGRSADMLRALAHFAHDRCGPSPRPPRAAGACRGEPAGIAEAAADAWGHRAIRDR